MKVSDLARLEVSLTKAVSEWWEGLEDSDIIWPSMPLIGEDTHAHMARGALSVLAGIADSQEYLRSEGVLADGD